MNREVAIVGSGAFVPGYAGLTGWVAGEPSPDHEKAKADLVPARQRRRASLLSKSFAEAFAETLETSALDASEVASVFGSALGEAATMISLLDQMWSETAMLSPMKFATSVHNAASGLISIATENRGFTTSLGADFDTPAMSLAEGIGLVLGEDRPVIVCCGDEAPPEELVPAGKGWSLMTAAIALAPVEQAPADAPRLSGMSVAQSDHGGQAARGEGSAGTVLTPGEMDAALGRNPNVGLLDLVTAVRRGVPGVVALDRGEGRGFVIRLETGRNA
ncbi:MAG: beta-ketoacyl synthase chain length factor [Myxococcota bacterium]